MLTQNIASAEEQIAVINETLKTSGKKALSLKEKKEFSDKYANCISRVLLYVPVLRDDQGNVKIDEAGKRAYDPNRDITVNIPLMHDTGGYQVLSHGEVVDNALPLGNSWNSHMQNTSKWLFGFGLVFDKEQRDFSMHT